MWNPGFQGTGKLVGAPNDLRHEMSIFPGKLMKCTCIYYNNNDDMQSLHFATCSFKPCASLDSICFYTVLSLCFVISQKYIVRITFRSTKREQTAETGSRNFNWNASKLSPFQQETILRSHPIPYIHFVWEILVSRRVFWWLIMLHLSWRWLITSDLFQTIFGPWNILSKWLVIISKRSPSKWPKYLVNEVY